jgi:hypothetical protein
MTTMTIPKTFRGSDDLIVLPRREYESLKARVVPEYVPTKTDLRALARMRKNRAAGKLISLDVLKRDLASRRGDGFFPVRSLCRRFAETWWDRGFVAQTHRFISDFL